MIGETAIAGIITGIIRTNKMDQWARLILSVLASGSVTFLTTMGAGGLAHLNAGLRPSLALAFAFFEACGTTAGIIWFKWLHDPLTKGMALSAPGSVLADQNKILLEQSIVTDNVKK